MAADQNELAMTAGEQNLLMAVGRRKLLTETHEAEARHKVAAKEKQGELTIGIARNNRKYEGITLDEDAG